VTKRKKVTGINPDLEKAISDLLQQVMADPEASLTDKSRVIDRALKLEAIRLKASDEQWGSGFLDDEDSE
jgi:hypothetical protein